MSARLGFSPRLVLALSLVLAAPARAAAPGRGDLLLTTGSGITSRILIVRAASGALEELTPQVGPSLLGRPEGITVGPDGSIYVADSVIERLLRIDPDTGEQSVLGSSDILGGGAPVVVPRARWLDHALSPILGFDELHVTSTLSLWRATRNPITGWSGGPETDLPDEIDNFFDIAVDDRSIGERPVYLAYAMGIAVYAPPAPCCGSLFTPPLLTDEGAPAYHASTSVDLLDPTEDGRIVVSQPRSHPERLLVDAVAARVDTRAQCVVWRHGALRARAGGRSGHCRRGTRGARAPPPELNPGPGLAPVGPLVVARCRVGEPRLLHPGPGRAATAASPSRRPPRR